MTVRKRFKRLVRARAAHNGESYTAALAHFRRPGVQSCGLHDEEPHMSQQPTDRFLGIHDHEYERMAQLGDLSPESVTEGLRHIGHPAEVAACKQVRTSAYNSIYDIDLDGAPATLHVWFGHSPDGADAELTLRRRLASCGLPLETVLVPAGDARLTVAGQPAVVFERAKGKEGPNYTPVKVTDAYAETAADMARLVAKVHVGALGLEHLAYREASWLESLAAWKPELDIDRAGERGRAVLDALEAAKTRFEAHCDAARLPVGVVHGCPGTWTVLTDEAGRVTTMLDVDSAHRDRLVFDLAHLLTQWGRCAVSESESRFEPVLVRRILEAYTEVRPLSHAEREALATAAPLRGAIDMLRIWNAVGNERIVPFSWSEYLDGQARKVELFEDADWRDLVVGAG